MKKILGVLAIAGALVACNNSADSTDKKIDSTDSAAKSMKKNIDSNTNVVKSTADSNAKAAKSAVDSNAKAKKDSIKGK